TRFLSDRRAIRPLICRTSGPDSRPRGNDGCRCPTVFIFVHPPYCVETPPGTRYNPPFNISENLFFNRSNRYKEPKMNPARKKPSLLFSSLLFRSAGGK
ncbi:TPA: hypothetical protein ACM5VO_001464, partial [Neisseria gonorrhoeae]